MESDYITQDNLLVRSRKVRKIVIFNDFFFKKNAAPQPSIGSQTAITDAQ